MKEKSKPKALLGFDPGRMEPIIRKLSAQCKEAAALAAKAKLPHDTPQFANVVMTGMGGSAIGGDLVSACYGDKARVPLVVNRDYSLPGFVDERSLVVCLSFSGGTEETRMARALAGKAGATVIAITGGGELASETRDGGGAVVRIPTTMPPEHRGRRIAPRTAVGRLFVPLAVVLGRLGVIPDPSRHVSETVKLLSKLAREWGVSADPAANLAWGISGELAGRVPVVYAASRVMGPVALRWQTQLNENSKSLAHVHLYPEMNHNEIVGWEDPARLGDGIAVVQLRDREDHKRVALRMDITRDLISSRPASFREVRSQGRCRMARMMSHLYLGDWTSFYLALRYGTDPTPVTLITQLKSELARHGDVLAGGVD